MAILSDSFTDDLEKLPGNVVDLDIAEQMEDDGQVLNDDDLDNVSKLQKSPHYIEIMQKIEGANVRSKGKGVLLEVDDYPEHHLLVENIINGNSNDTIIFLYSMPPRAVYSTVDGTGEKDHPEGYLFHLIYWRPWRGTAMKQVKVETIVEHGDARNVICQAAEKLHVDMLVIVSHGYGVINRTFLGSVSNHCARNVKCPVLIVKKAKN